MEGDTGKCLNEVSTLYAEFAHDVYCATVLGGEGV